MSEELYFNNELRKCLNAAGLSDCGENDAWNYWYQRVHKAHDQTIDRVTEVQRAENAKLREYVTELETANLDVTARLADYIGQYDPTDAFVAEVKAENAKLLDQKADAYNDMVNAQLDADALQAENAKLRELVRDMHKWLWNGADCTECPFVAKCDLNAAFESDIHAHVCLGWSEIHRRMRELGVEVDA